MNLLPFIVSGLGIGAVYALAGVGLVMLYRTTGVMNLAFGAVGAFGAFVAFSANKAGLPILFACGLGICTSVLLSSGYGRYVAPVLAYRDTIARSVGTLGFALILLGVMGLIWGEMPRRIQYPTDRMYVNIFGTRLTGTRMIALACAFVTVSSLSYVIAKTRLGLKMRSVAESRDITALLGVRILQVEFFAWLIAGLFAGVTGLLLANLVGLKAAPLTFLVVPAIAAAILGRLQSLIWTAIAGVAIGVLEATLTAFPLIAPYRAASPFIIALFAVGILAMTGASERKA